MTQTNFAFRHGFIGIGRMAQIILSSLLQAKKLKPQEVLVSRKSLKELKKISKKFHEFLQAPRGF